MNKVLTVHNATIKTAGADIKIMRLDGKQVTLATFRQMKTLNIIDEETGKLKGLPWGHVNYHPDCKLHEDEHLHVVWQTDQDDLLRRCVVTGYGWRNTTKYEQLGQSIVDLTELYVYASTINGTYWNVTNTGYSTISLGFDRMGHRYSVDLFKQAYEVWCIQRELNAARGDMQFLGRAYDLNDDRQRIYANRHYSTETAGYVETDVTVEVVQAYIDQKEHEMPKKLIAVKKVLAEAAKKLSIPESDCTEQALDAEIDRLINERQQYIDTWQQTYDGLVALDQLFIAV